MSGEPSLDLIPPTPELTPPSPSRVTEVIKRGLEMTLSGGLGAVAAYEVTKLFPDQISRDALQQFIGLEGEARLMAMIGTVGGLAVLGLIEIIREGQRGDVGGADDIIDDSLEGFMGDDS